MTERKKGYEEEREDVVGERKRKGWSYVERAMCTGSYRSCDLLQGDSAQAAPQ